MDKKGGGEILPHHLQAWILLSRRRIFQALQQVVPGE